MNIPAAQAAPYMAAHSFGPADIDLFFGRDAEGISLARFVQDQPLSVLTAPSGVGKTSLLHARVAPLLEKQQWLAVLARPGENLLQSMQNALFEHMLPSPVIETVAVQQMIAVVPGGEGVSISDACNWYDGLRFQERVAYRFFAPPGRGAMPIFCRVLRGTVTLDEALEHYEAMAADGPFLGVDPTMSLAALRDTLNGTGLLELWKQWQGVIAGAPSLPATIETIERTWLPLRPGLSGVLLVIDQFEEVFTRLPVEHLDRFFADVRTLISAGASSGQRIGHKPVHITLSLRKEFFADLMPRLEPFGNAEQLTFFLGALTRPQAREAFARPLEKLGFVLDPTTQDGKDIVDRVLDETIQDDDLGIATDMPQFQGSDRRFAAMVISLLGAHLWNKLRGGASFDSLRAGTELFGWKNFHAAVPKLENVFDEFLRSVLAELPNDASRFDAVELLDRLTTSGGYRNIILEADLIDQLPLREPAAEALLDRLDRDLRLIRRESRRGGRYVEIVHERIVAPVRQYRAYLQRLNPMRAILPHALDQLYLLREDEIDPLLAHPLNDDYRETLLQHLDRLQLDPLALKTLLESALIAGPSPEREDMIWHKSVRELAAELATTGASLRAKRPVLLEGDLLDRELEKVLSDGEASIVMDDWWLAARSALADISDGGQARVRKVMQPWLLGRKRE